MGKFTLQVRFMISVKAFPYSQVSIFFILLLAFIFNGCETRDKGEISASEISYEINNSKITFKSTTEIRFSFLGWIQTAGQEIPSDHLFIEHPEIKIRVKDHGKPVRPGVYSGKTYDSSGYTREAYIYCKGLNNRYYESSFENAKAEVKIQFISRNGIEGTFSGLLIEINGGNDTLNVRNGKFTIYNYKR